jgi:hypothetical protein
LISASPVIHFYCSMQCTAHVIVVCSRQLPVPRCMCLACRIQSCR